MTELLASAFYSIRACLPRKRQAGLAVLGLVAIAFGLLTRAFTTTPASGFASTASLALFALVLPLMGLVAGDAVMGAEVRRGTFHFTWISPAPAWSIAIGRWLGGTLIVASVSALAFAGSGFVAGAPVESSLAAAAAAAIGSAAYVALFIAVAATFRRSPSISLAIVFLGERLLGTVLTSIAQISPMWEARAAFAGWAPAAGLIQRKGIPSGYGAGLRLVIITLVCLAIATWRLRSMQLSTSAAD